MVYQRQSRRKFFFRKRVCKFCQNKIEYIDYKNVELLSKYIRDRGKIVPRRMSGTCAKHQVQLTKAIKRARNMALLSYNYTAVSTNV